MMVVAMAQSRQVLWISMQDLQKPSGCTNNCNSDAQMTVYVLSVSTSLVTSIIHVWK